ncbi:hypothetical protein IMAU70004_02837 [Lactiplantibacillus plantarum]|nr:hypothetical protein [Lactiplantibacillus plantarum]
MRLRTLYEKIEMELPHIEGIKLTTVANNNSGCKLIPETTFKRGYNE